MQRPYGNAWSGPQVAGFVTSMISFLFKLSLTTITRVLHLLT